ncbi:MAG: signal peptidase II [Bacteroidales bacterium]|nr:signal peptidase II [Bacteroidales bacterium]
MKKSKIQLWVAILLMVLIVAIDQWIKIYIKTHFVLHESYKVTSWFYLSFIENNGMAFGMELVGKLWLTLFRIVAVAMFGWFLFSRIKTQKSTYSFVVSMSMVIAGAIGNIIDCIFYGRWFTAGFGKVAQWADAEKGLMPYGEWLQGKVVDMFYFPLIRFDWPDWMPHSGQLMDWGIRFYWPSWMPCSNEPFMFFKPVFNFADAAISVGVAFLFIIYYISTRNEGKSAK